MCKKNSYNNSRGFQNNGPSIADILNDFQSAWITKGADEALVTFAEKAGKFMAINGLTTSKIRSFYGEIKRIQMGTFEKEKSAFYLLRPKITYAYARNAGPGLDLFKKIFEKASPYVAGQKGFNNLANLMEAILAYHKANGGKDK